MNHNIKCEIAYCGTHYFGWQKTKVGATIEESLQTVLEKVLQHPIQLQAASRTDRGVHAQHQVINFFTPHKRFNLEKLLCSMRRLLPPDISPLSLEWAENDFHPTLDNQGKEYHYLICNSRSQFPFHREFSWHCPAPLDIASMQKGGTMLEGTRDFSAFSNLYYEDSVRTLHEVKVIPLEKQRLCIQVKGEAFLNKMVRNIVGTLVAIGQGKIPLETLSEIMESKKRALAGMTAPAHGLSLIKIFY